MKKSPCKKYPWLDYLISDYKPRNERLNFKVIINEIRKNKIEEFCARQKDTLALQKMKFHELVREPVENVIAISQENFQKIKEKYFKRLLQDMGYNTRVYFAKNNGADLKAAMSINGYLVPGWSLMIRLIRKFSKNKARFFGKKFSPGRSRLHTRIYEGNNYWYATAHIDKYNFFHYNILGIRRSHLGCGNGDYENGTKYFLESLKYYFENYSLNKHY